jgi:hypothetical protein
MLALCLCCLFGCGETVKMAYRDGSTETYHNVTDFRCQPSGCLKNGVGHSVGFCVGVQCILDVDFQEAIHTWYDKPEPCTDCWWYLGEGLLP